MIAWKAFLWKTLQRQFHEIFWSHWLLRQWQVFSFQYSNYFGLFFVQSLEMRSFNRNLMSQVLNFEYSFWNYPLQNSIIHQFSMLLSRFGQFSYSPILFCSSFSVGMFRHDCLNMPWRLSNYTQVIFAIWCCKSFQLV